MSETLFHNGKGEQVRRTAGTTSTYTVYDEAGHWLGDYTGTAVRRVKTRPTDSPDV